MFWYHGNSFCEQARELRPIISPVAIIVLKSRTPIPIFSVASELHQVPDRTYIIIIMGKKSKANRKKAPIATATATEVEITAAGTVAVWKRLPNGEFPQSAFLVKGVSFSKKGNISKAKKMYLQGIENGCVPCLQAYTMKILFDGKKMDTRDNVDIVELVTNNMNLHLVLPLLLEGAIRGNHDAVVPLSGAYVQVYKTEDKDRYGAGLPAAPLLMYWKKIGLKNWDREDERRTKTKQKDKELKEACGAHCSVCRKKDSETVTLMKCDGCKFYYYCSKECQTKMWVEGEHAGVCRQLGLLNKYHKPFAKKIRRDIVVHQIAPQDIPELQELRQRLGLSRPHADYQELLEVAKAGRLDPDSAQLILPRKDGTVQIGSFPRPI